MSKNAPALWDKFLAYYGAATDGDTALTRREKALIGLAVARDTAQLKWRSLAWRRRIRDCRTTLRGRRSRHVASCADPGRLDSGSISGSSWPVHPFA